MTERSAFQTSETTSARTENPTANPIMANKQPRIAPSAGRPNEGVTATTIRCCCCGINLGSHSAIEYCDPCNYDWCMNPSTGMSDHGIGGNDES